MKGKYAYIYICTISMIVLADKNPDEEILITIVNASQQSTQSGTQNECLPCQKLYGKKLKNCMTYQADDLFKKQFFSMNYNARLQYLTSLGMDEHYALILRFKNEQEWHEERNKLSLEEKKYLPKTLAEQQHVLKDARTIAEWHIEIDCFFRKLSDPCSPEVFNNAIKQRYQALKKELLNRYQHPLD